MTDIVILDGEIATGGSVVALLARLREHRVGRISLVCTHGLFTHDALARLSGRGDLTEIATTDTVPLPPGPHPGELTVRSVAPLFADAISRIHLGESVSNMFA